MESNLSDEEREAFQEIFNLLIPSDFNIFGYTKDRLLTKVMKIIEDDVAIMRLKMRKVYKILGRLAENV